MWYAQYKVLVHVYGEVYCHAARLLFNEVVKIGRSVLKCSGMAPDSALKLFCRFGKIGIDNIKILIYKLKCNLHIY